MDNMITCHICNKPNNKLIYDDITNKRITEEKLCYICLYWIKLIEDDKLIVNQHRLLRINHVHYYISDKHNGIFDTYEMKVKWLDDNSIVEYKFVSYNGAIPEYFWDKLPNNAEQVK